MDLQISVVLLFSFFTAAHSFSCYECRDSCASQTIKTCPSGYSKCMSSTTVIQAGGTTYTSKAKGCAADCVTGSMNFGVSRQSLSCCDTDNCNAQDAPAPSNDPNGKTCYTCDDKSCSNKLSCTGNEDRCFTTKVFSAGVLTAVKGCVSKSICDSFTSVNDFQSVSCCEGNLCNGAASVSQSFLFLCCSLLSFILLH